MFAMYRSSVGKKFVVAASGLLLVLFVVGHMLGNLKTFLGFEPGTNLHALDHYAQFLRSMGSEMFGLGTLLWLVRGGLLLVLCAHVATVIALRRQNQAAHGPGQYRKQRFGVASYAARSMWLGGVLLFAFIIFHLLHFTVGVLPLHRFEEGRVFQNVSVAFGAWYLVLLYLGAMLLLGLHLFHGVWSVFQTLGIDSPQRNRGLRRFAMSLAFVVSLGFSVVPLALYLGLVPSAPVHSAGEY